MIQYLFTLVWIVFVIISNISGYFLLVMYVLFLLHHYNIISNFFVSILFFLLQYFTYRSLYLLFVLWFLFCYFPHVQSPFWEYGQKEWVHVLEIAHTSRTNRKHFYIHAQFRITINLIWSISINFGGGQWNEEKFRTIFWTHCGGILPTQAGVEFDHPPPLLYPHWKLRTSLS